MTPLTVFKFNNIFLNLGNLIVSIKKLLSTLLATWNEGAVSLITRLHLYTTLEWVSMSRLVEHVTKQTPES